MTASLFRPPGLLSVFRPISTVLQLVLVLIRTYDFQRFQSPFQCFRGRFKHSNYNWYHRHSQFICLFCLFVLFVFVFAFFFFTYLLFFSSLTRSQYLTTFLLSFMNGKVHKTKSTCLYDYHDYNRKSNEKQNLGPCLRTKKL